MKKYMFIPLVAAIIGQSCQSGTTADQQDTVDSTKQVEKAKDPAAGKPKTTNNFVTQAAIGGLMEVESGVLMVRSTENPDVQNLATIMVKDHGAANTELALIAKKLAVELPKELPMEKKAVLAKLNPLQEDEKNLSYAQLMVKDHEQAVALFQTAANAETGELKTFAERKLPVLKQHLLHSKKVFEMLNSIKNDKGDLPLKISQSGPKQ